MPMLSSNSNYQWTVSLKILLISTGVLSLAVFLKLSVPVVTDFVVSEIPSIWSCLLSWLRPPYLYLVMNCIIISIVASSKLQQKLDGPPVEILEAAAPRPVAKISSDARPNYVVYGGADVSNGYSYNTNQNVSTKISDLQMNDSNGRYGRMKVEPRVLDMEEKGEDECLTAMNAADEEASKSNPMTNSLQRNDSVSLLFSDENEKPPISSRIGQRKSVKASPEGKALGVAKPKRHDTLESTWRAITEGRSMPLTRHLKKSDTWESHGRRNITVDPATPPSKMKKSETFNDRTGGNSSLSPSPGGSGRLKRESSLTHDELNRRVEAFIKKFNEEMRLQRQESLKQYQEMMAVGPTRF